MIYCAGRPGWAEQLSDSNVEAHGLTKHVRAGDVYYEKRAGKGPNVISAIGSRR